MSGIELQRQLQASGSSTPVIYITAHDEPEVREQAEAGGCVAYFRKTAPGQDVLRAIHRAASLKEGERLDEDHPRRHAGRQPVGFARVRPVVLRRLERPVRPLPDRHRLLPAQRRHRPPLQRPAGSGDVNLEKDLGVEREREHVLGGRDLAGRAAPPAEAGLHHASAATGPTTRSQRDFTWGGETYNAGLSATTTSGSDILGGYYRFAAYRNDRFEIGPTIGIGYLWIKRRHPGHGDDRRRHEPLARPEREHAAASRAPSAATRTAGSRSASSRGRTTSTSR